MHTLVLASQKGGAGKTTLTLHIAVAAELAGLGPVAMIDTDPQGTLAKWRGRRQADTPVLVAGVRPDGIVEAAGKLAARGFGLLVVDTPPAITDSIEAVIGAADLVLMPVRPSPADLWAVGATIALCRKQHRPHAFVLCQAVRGATVTVQAVAALSAHGVVSEAVIHARVGYATALATGRVIQEVEPKGQGAGEVAELLAFVRARLEQPAEEVAR